MVSFGNVDFSSGDGDFKVPKWRQNWPSSSQNRLKPFFQNRRLPSQNRLKLHKASFFPRSLHEKPTISTMINADQLNQFADDTDQVFKETYRGQIKDNLDENQKIDLKTQLLNLVNLSLEYKQFEVFDKLVELMLNQNFTSEQLSSFRDSENNNIALVLIAALDNLCQEYLSLPERAENFNKEQMQEEEEDLSIALGNLIERIDRASDKPEIAGLKKVIAQAQKKVPFNLLEEAQKGLIKDLQRSLRVIEKLNTLDPSLELTRALDTIKTTFGSYLSLAA